MYEVPIPCQKDRLGENRIAGAKREGFIEDLGHRLPRGIVLCVCVCIYVCVCVCVYWGLWICMFAWIPLCLHVYVVTRACVSYTTDFLIKTNHTFIVFHIESCYLCRKSFNGEPKLLALVVVKVLIYTNHVLFWIPPEFLSKLPFSASDWLASLLAFATLNCSFPGEHTDRQVSAGLGCRRFATKLIRIT